MSPAPVVGIVLLLAVPFLTGYAYYLWVTFWRGKFCDACRLDLAGEAHPTVPHACSSRRAIYRTKGRTYEFGREVRTYSPVPPIILKGAKRDRKYIARERDRIAADRQSRIAARAVFHPRKDKDRPGRQSWNQSEGGEG